ncbi:MAG: GntR family transcriptional regulator [Firmicutes bacterium]|nr:GntR family transcriptional regulator [Bacillota bacterium]
MNLAILSKSNKPIYEQIYDQIVAQIISGELEAHFCLPSIRVVASQLGVSVITIKKAWELLEADQFIYTKAGKGCFVTEYAPLKLDDKKILLGREKIRQDIQYYKGLGLSLEEILKIITEEF